MIHNNFVVPLFKYKDLVDIHFQICMSKYKDKWVELTLTHSMIVTEIAEQIISKLNQKGVFVDNTFVHKAIILHDIGVYNCFDSEFNNNIESPKYIAHGQIGHDIIMERTGDQGLARVALTHTGFGGITISEIEESNLPIRKENMLQTTLEEELVAWSDKFHTKWPKFYTIQDVEDSARKFGDSKLAIYNYYKLKFGVPDTSELESKYQNWHKEFNNFIESIEE